MGLEARNQGDVAESRNDTKTLRQSGIDVIGNIPWGTHFCQFYETSRDLVDILVPYFKEGLKSNEFCMWITSEPLNVKQAAAALRAEVSDLDDRIREGQIEILDYSQWYTRSGKFNSDDVLRGWVDKLAAAQKRGYEGLRLTGNTLWLEQNTWNDFTRYENAVNNVIGHYRMLAVCTYSLRKCGASEIMDVISNHQFALVKRSGRWEIVESSSYKKLDKALHESEKQFQALFNSMTEGFALHEIITDETGKPVDYRFLDVNPAFERLVGLRRENIVGRTVTEVLPGTEPVWIEKYGRVALSGEPVHFEERSASLDKHYDVYAYRPAAGQFAVIFSDVTQRIKAQEALQASRDRLNRAEKIANLGSWELNLVNNHLTWSDEAYRLFGLKPQEFEATYEAFLDRVHPDDRAAVDAAYTNSVNENREGYEIEHRVVRKHTGEVRFVHEKCEHIRDKSGRIVRSVGMVLDITSRKAGEEALRQAKEQWERTFDSVPDLIAILDDRHRILQVNRAMAKRLGREPADCVGAFCYRAIHGMENPIGSCPHSCTLQDGLEHIAEVHEDKLGGDFLVSTTPLLDSEGRNIGSVHVARDITERKRIEAEIHNLALFPEQNPNPVIRAVLGGKVLYTNNPAAKLLESTGWKKDDCLPEPMAEWIQSTLDKGIRQEFELPFPPDRIYAFVLAPIPERGYVNLYGRDITNRKRAEKALLDANESLESQVEARTVELTRTVELLDGMLDNTHMCIAYMDADFNFIRVNEAYAVSGGHEPDYYVGKNHFELYPQAENEAIFREVVQTGEPVTFYEKPFIYAGRPDLGVSYWDWTLRPLKDAHGKVTGLLLSLLDVTRQVRSRKQIEDEQRKLFSVLNMLPGYAVIKGPDYRLRFSSHGFLEAFGEPSDRPCYEIQYGRSEPCENCPLPRILSTGQQEDWEYTYPNGRTFHVWAFPFADVDGTDAMLQLGFDVTEQKKIELEIAEISETERRRIGRDLHDTLGQQLTSVGYLLSGLMRKVAKISPQDKPASDRIIEAINKAVGQVRSLAHGLDPIGLEADGLIAVLRELTEGVSDTSKIPCRFRCGGSVQLDSSVATHLYRICQEAVNNAVKHAEAKEIIVSLTHNNGELSLSIEDDGVGLPDSLHDNRGMGLRTMNYRAGAIGANLIIKSGRNGGTIVKCVLKSPVSSSSSGDNPS